MFFASVCNSRSKYRRNSERVKERVIELLICLRVVGREKGRRFSIKSLCSREQEKTDRQQDTKIEFLWWWWWLLPWNCDYVCVCTRSNWNSAVVLNVTFLVFFSSSFLNPVSLFILHLVCFRSKRFCSVLLFCLLGVVPCQKCCECIKKKEKKSKQASSI